MPEELAGDIEEPNVLKIALELDRTMINMAS
jgi:hypothetical protein